MPKGAYSRLLRKHQESIAANRELQQQINGRESRIAELEAFATQAPERDPSPPAAPIGASKLSQFWTSTPVWGGLGVLITLIVSPWSVKLVYFAMWAVFVFEFIRIKVYEDKRCIRFALNASFSLVLALGFIMGWPDLAPAKRIP
ncbi:MAG: hypothetical protein P4L87_09690 [Formivibrio sp.]|nr:hypothetical protein [Formivibrio sp.]